jgi:hypothetical protein
MTRGAHGRGQNFSANTDLERLLGCQLIRQILERAIAISPNDFLGSDRTFFHVGRLNVIMMPVEICHLYISPGHNFFGHHCREPDQYPAIEVAMIECAAGHGIRGDRFFDYREDYKGQITFFSLEVFDELCGTFELKDCSPSLVRRNVMTRAVDLNELVDRDFEVQGVKFHGTGECRPCYWMNQAIAPGAEEFLKGRGGLRARILSDGQLRSTARLQ